MRKRREHCGGRILRRAWSGCISVFVAEPVDGDVIYFDPEFGEEFFNVAVGESVSEISTDSQHDLRREPVTGESATILWEWPVPTMIHLDTLARHRADPSTKQFPWRA